MQKKLVKAVVYIMIAALLLSTLLTGIAFF